MFYLQLGVTLAHLLGKGRPFPLGLHLQNRHLHHHHHHLRLHLQILWGQTEIHFNIQIFREPKTLSWKTDGNKLLHCRVRKKKTFFNLTNFINNILKVKFSFLFPLKHILHKFLKYIYTTNNEKNFFLNEQWKTPFSPQHLFIHYFAFPQCVFCPVPPTLTSTTPPYCSRWQSFLPVKEFFLPTVSECLVQY